MAAARANRGNWTKFQMTIISEPIGIGAEILQFVISYRQEHLVQMLKSEKLGFMLVLLLYGITHMHLYSGTSKSFSCLYKNVYMLCTYFFMYTLL